MLSWVVPAVATTSTAIDAGMAPQISALLDIIRRSSVVRLPHELGMVDTSLLLPRLMVRMEVKALPKLSGSTPESSLVERSR